MSRRRIGRAALVIAALGLLGQAQVLAEDDPLGVADAPAVDEAGSAGARAPPVTTDPAVTINPEVATDPAGTTDPAVAGEPAAMPGRELPRVMHVVPWKRALPADLQGRPGDSLLGDVLAPLDREVFRRELRYHADLHGKD